ncbi:MAG TPA: hypothetical protein VII92_17230, partial [Anaerolineae bacterium]
MPLSFLKDLATKDTTPSAPPALQWRAGNGEKHEEFWDADCADCTNKDGKSALSASYSFNCSMISVTLNTLP